MLSGSSHFRYRYRLTRLGFHFVFVALFAIVGGSLRGFNLLLILAGLLVGTMLLQWRSGRSNIRLPRLKRGTIVGSHAGTPLSLRYVVANSSRWLPCWMIRIEDQIRPIAGPAVEEVHDPHGIDQAETQLVASVGSVPPGGAASTSISCLFSKRGVYRLGPTSFSSTFPFSLIQNDCFLDGQSRELAVYPPLLPLKRGWQTLLPPHRGGDGARSTGGNNHEGEFFGLRHWQSGDHVKHIHWRTTARIGEPAVRQFEQRNRHQICIIVDGRCSADSSNSIPNSDHHFELILQIAATVVCELVQSTRGVSLLVYDALPDRQCYRSTSRDTTPLLERLARAIRISPESTTTSRMATEPRKAVTAEADTFFTDIAESIAQFQRDDVLVISESSMRSTLQSANHESKGYGLLQHLIDTGRLSWIDVRSQHVQQYLHRSTPSNRSSSRAKHDTMTAAQIQKEASQHVER